ncbi:MAG: hypothetical protein JWM81_1023 [Candidatus Saccharibacteria bacterium]|nr:hypothetical protein [Candidatus Saccharibacteria bacterium]
MKSLRLLAAGALVILTGLTATAGVANADTNDFTITNFASVETLSRTDPHGQLHVVETINLAYTDNNHGILRAIPNTYKKQKLDLHINSVSSPTRAPASYTTYQSNGNTVLKIGDANRTVTGEQSYVIDYTLHNVISFYNDHSELYWDVNGDQWDQPFETVTASLHLPSDVQLDSTKTARCFTGSYGSHDANCMVYNDGRDIIFATTSVLAPRQTLSYVTAFKTGYFTAPTAVDRVKNYVVPAAKLLALPLVVFITSFTIWFRFGRDAKGRGTIVPEYAPPDNMTPLQVGALIDFEVDDKDLTATIVDLAIRGYITIIEQKVVRLKIYSKLLYNFELANDDFSKLNSNEITLMNAIFQDKPIGTQVDVAGLKNSLYTTATALKKSVNKQLKADGYFRSSAGKPGTNIAATILIAAFLAAFILIEVGGGLLIASVIISTVIVILFRRVMNARTTKGVLANEKVAGLKLYLQTAEADRIKMLQSPDAPYAAQGTGPARTVDLFEKLLPYAIILGVETQWAKQFADLYKQPPSWFNGSSNNFNSVYLASAVSSNINSAVATAFSAPTSSGSSGFSGGGFSGGGGGGGGGGGW